MCQHNVLRNYDDFTGIEVSVEQRENQISNVSGMFEYKKYVCEECNAIITVLNAIVENQ